MTVERRGETSDAAAMKFPWSFFAPRTTPPKLTPPAPNADAELTRTAARLLREAGAEAVAAQVAVVWHSRLSSTAGLARPASALVLLNPRLKAFPEEVERTLRHELAHLLAYARSRGRRIAAHGPEWKQACVDLGIPGESRCHTLPLPRRQVNRPHVYRCPRCDFHLRRVRPIKARRRLACHDCCKRHAGGRFDRRFEFVRVKPAIEKPPHPASGGVRRESMEQQTLNF